MNKYDQIPPKSVSEMHINPYFWKPYSKIFVFTHFDPHLAPFGSLLASLWLPFCSRWHPLGDLWVPSVSLLASCGSILSTPGVHFLTFGISWRRFWSLAYIFYENPIKSHVLFGQPTWIAYMDDSLQYFNRLPIKMTILWGHSIGKMISASSRIFWQCFQRFFKKCSASLA